MLDRGKENVIVYKKIKDCTLKSDKYIAIALSYGCGNTFDTIVIEKYVEQQLAHRNYKLERELNVPLKCALQH